MMQRKAHLVGTQSTMCSFCLIYVSASVNVKLINAFFSIRLSQTVS